MKALKVLKKPPNLSVDEFVEFIKKECHKIQVAIFSVMPDGCFLKGWNSVDLKMVFMLSPKMIERRIVSRKDVCALCSAEDRPYNKVNHKKLRIIKVILLGNLYNQ